MVEWAWVVWPSEVLRGLVVFVLIEKMESFGGLEVRGAGEDVLGWLDEEARSEDRVELNVRLAVDGGGVRLRF